MPDRKREERPDEKPLTPDERVDEAIEESFPASDPPSYTPGEPGSPPGRKESPPKPPKDTAPQYERENVARLRDDIDHGRTRDKVAHFDPAAAPLGTDDEAAGFPMPRMPPRERP